MIKLIITDLDGTFLNSRGDFDRVSFAGIRAMMAERGIHFAVCTGKQCDRVEALFGEFCQDLWIVGDSATRIKYNGEFIYQSLLGNSPGREIIRTLQQVNPHHVIIACTPEHAVIHQDTPQYLKDRIRQSYARVRETRDLCALEDDFVKISVYDEAGSCPQTRPHLAPFENLAYIVVSEAAWIDIAAYGVHKGSTIEKLQQRLQASVHETVAFGDGYNDIELLVRAEYSFAMRNAFAETKAVANFITGGNDENAVQQTIRRLLALQA